MPEPANTLLSVIIVNRNTANLLIRCLEHLFRSELVSRPEVVIVDNGSEDDSVARVQEAYPEVKIIQAGRNLGFAKANNQATRVAQGKYLLLVNTDAMLDPQCAATLIELMESDSSIAMAGPQLLNDDGTPQTSYEAVPTLATETLNRSLLKRLFPRRYPGRTQTLTQPTQVEAVIGAVMMIRRDALDRVGGFDEEYFFFLEETDLAVRLRSTGWKIVHHPRATAVHLQGATANTYQAAARIEFYRSRYIFFQKHYGYAAREILKYAMIVNLALNVIYLGLVNLVTFGRLPKSANRFRVRYELWKWHMRGCPSGAGLPRS